MQFCDLPKFADCRFTLVFQVSDGFFPRFRERFFFAAERATTPAK
jgi:hypothetical protein